MICLGIESTAHTFGVGVINDKGNVLANVKDVYTTEKGGINPNEAKLHHTKFADALIKNALSNAKIKADDIGIISFSQGPGLPPCLVVGMHKAKELAEKYNKKVVGVNHCIAHLEIGKLTTGATNPILLYASGANTQIIAFEGNQYRIFGETLDQGAGNFIDAFARYIGLGFPGGPKIYELSLKSSDYIELPYIVKGMDVSFSGLLTNLKQKHDSGKFKKEDLAYSLQETAFAMLTEITERAMAHCGKDELLLGGGVCCNIRLQDMLKRMCKGRDARCFIPPNEVLVDNGLMIAWLGLLEQERATDNLTEIDIKPNWRTDQAEWRKIA